MKYAVVYVQPPGHGSAGTQVHNWNWFLTNESAPKLIRYGKPEWHVGGGVWVIPVAEGMPAVLALAEWCRGNKCTFRALYLNEPPEWSVVEPDGW